MTSTANLRYWCDSPVESLCRSLEEISTSVLSKREEKRRLKRRITADLASGGMSSDRTSGTGTPLVLHDPLVHAGSMQRPRPSIFPPSTFLLESFNAAEWTEVHRRRIKASNQLRPRQRRRPLSSSSTARFNFNQRADFQDHDSNFENIVVGHAGLITNVMHGHLGQCSHGLRDPDHIVAVAYSPVQTPDDEDRLTRHRPPDLKTFGGGLRRILGHFWRNSAAAATCICPVEMSREGSGGGVDPGAGGEDDRRNSYGRGGGTGQLNAN